MISGINFQPADLTQHGAKRTRSQGVQEAIKVLSLRLPRVVGAQALAPSALLNSQGSGGRVDGVVSQIMSQLFGAGQPPPSAPMIPQAMSAPDPVNVAPHDNESSTMPVRIPGVSPGTGPSFTGVSPTTPLQNFMPPQAFAPVSGPPRITPGNTAPGTQTPAPHEWEGLGFGLGGESGETESVADPPVTGPTGNSSIDDLYEYLRRRSVPTVAQR